VRTLALRPLSPEADLPLVERLCAGRNVDVAEYARFLALEGAFGLVLEEEGRALGAVTAMRCFDHGIVGPVLFAADAEGAGVSAPLLARAVEALQRSGVPRVEAEAGAEEEAVLRGMGFATVRRTLVLEREPLVARTPVVPYASRAMTAADLLDVGALDAAAVGYGRKEYIAELRAAFPEGARVVADADGGLAGFALLRRARRGHHLGPIVTRAHDGRVVAAALLDDAVARVAGGPIVALVPDGTPLAGALARHDFEQVGALARMRAGDAARDEPTDRATEWALGGRLTG
jgi:hypothetical protein